MIETIVGGFLFAASLAIAFALGSGWTVRKLLAKPTSYLASIVLPRYATDPERLARLDRLRQSLMNEWEESLEIEGSNLLSGVPFSRIVGLVDIVRWVVTIRQEDAPDYADKRLTERIDEYLRELDFAKTREGRDR